MRFNEVVDTDDGADEVKTTGSFSVSRYLKGGHIAMHFLGFV